MAVPAHSTYAVGAGQSIHGGRYAPAQLGGAIALDAAVAAGALGQAGVLAGGVTLDPTVAAGGFGQQAPAGAFTSVQLLSPDTATAPFTFGLALKQGDVPAGSGIQVSGAAGWQATVKNAWPDGSAKFAIVAGTAALTAGVALQLSFQAGVDSSGTALTTADLQAAMAQPVTIDAGAFGTASFSGADWLAPFATWVSGHRMSSWIYRKPVGADAHLVAWLEVRLFAGGEVEILPWVENGYLNVAGPGSKSATYTVTIGGTQRFSAAIYLYARQRTPLVSGTALSHWLGTSRDVVVKHDRDYLQASELVPAYGTDISPTHAQVTGLPSTYTPLQQGVFEPNLDVGGFHNGVCLLPHWDALHLASAATSTYKAVIFQAYSAGRYAFHCRDEATNLPPRINDAAFANTTAGTLPAPAENPAQGWSNDHQPAVGYLAYLVTGRYYFMEEVQFVASSNFLLGSALAARNYGQGLYSASFNVRAQAWGVRGLVYAATATPDADVGQLRSAYLAHLTNNINYFWGRYINQAHNPFGFINGPVGSNKWGPYNLNLNATPTGGTTTTVRFAVPAFQSDVAGAASYIGQQITVGVAAYGDHLRTITAWSVSGGEVTFELSGPPMAGPPGAFPSEMIPKYATDAPWMQDYSIATWGIMKSLKLPFDATTEARREAFWQWHAGQIIGRMGAPGATEYLYRNCSPYVIAVAPVNQSTLQGPNWDTGAGPWFANWGEVYDATYIAAGGATGLSYLIPLDAGGTKAEGPMRVGGFDLADPVPQQGQFANSMRAIAYAVKHGVPGAEAGFHRIASSANYHKFIQGMETAGFAQGALAPFARPKWARGQAVMEWRQVAGTSAYACVPSRQARTTAGVLEAYDWAARWAYGAPAIDARRSTVWSIGNGGHGDYYGNEAIKIDMMRDEPAWVEQCPGSGGNCVVKGVSPSPSLYNTDDFGRTLPASAHSYFGSQFIERHSRAIRAGGAISPSGTGIQDCPSFNVDLAIGADGYDPFRTYDGWNGGAGAAMSGAIAACCCKDPRTDRLYVVTTPSQISVMTPNVGSVGGTWSVFASAPFSPYTGWEGCTAVDTTRNQLMWTKGNHIDGGKPYFLNLATATWDTSRVFPAGGAKAGFDALGSGPGLIFVPRLDAFLARGVAAGDTIYRIDGATLAITTLATTGGSGIPIGQVVTGQEAVYTRLLWAPHLRSLIYFPGAASNAWVLRLY